MIKPQKCKATISYKELVSSKVYEVRFVMSEPQELQFKAGQTVMIYISPGINRTMSIASSPNNTKELILCWDVSPMGPGAHWLLDRKIGDVVEFMAPLGAFYYDVESKRKAIFVATGTGVSPFRGYLETYLPTGEMQETALYWGLRYDDDVFWRNIFEELQTKYPMFHSYITLSQGSDSWNGLRGRVTNHLFSNPIDIEHTDYYLCGSGAMVREVMERLEQAGVPDRQIKRELFFN